MKSLKIKLLLIFIFIIIVRQNIFCQEIEAVIDLKHCNSDKLFISLNLKQLNKSDSIVYHFPKTIPGLYKIVDFGKFVKDFKAYDISGKQLTFNRNAYNEFIIYESSQLSKIEYFIDDTWDEEISKESIFYPAGTRFENDKFFLINLYAIIGYIDENTQIKYTLSINKPQNLNLITADKYKIINDSINVIKFNSFNELSNEPILISHPDTISFTSNNCKYIINTYSENQLLNSTILLDTIKSVIDAVNFHFNDLVSDTYYINLVYDNWLDQRGGGMEHKNSCVIVLSNRIKIEHLYYIVKEKVAHEYLHCISPLNLHSTLTENFDYSGKTCTKLLWFYEGVTEFLSMKILLNKKLISSSKFLKEIGCNIYDNEKMNDKNYSLETISNEILTESFNEFFMNFYYRGSLTAFTYDIWLQKQTNYNYNLTALMKDMIKENKSKPFAEDSIYTYFAKFSNTKNDEFIDLYVKGKQDLPIKRFFKEVDLNVTDSLKIAFNVSRYYITNASNIQDINNNIYFIPDSSKSIFGNDTIIINEINYRTINKNEAIQNLMYANNEKFLNIKYEMNKNIIQNDLKALVVGFGNNYYLILNSYKPEDNKFIKFINSN